ncbi:MAG: hypothetical protein JXR89_05340 [Deltaproteobacteria bacterium]|nr:hypothetical protein [Deltaproteobacteria bacterium]
MTPSQIRTYSRNYDFQQKEAADFIEIVQSIPTLTRLGAVLLVMGKLMGVMAIPAAFIPSLNILVVPLIFAWGSLVFCSIALCSVDHFRKKKARSEKEQMELIATMIEETPALREKLQEELENGHSNRSAVIIPLAVGQ